MLCEAYFIANFCGRLVDASVANVLEYFPSDERLDSAGFQQRNLLRVSQVGVRLVFQQSRSSLRFDRIQAVKRIGFAFLHDFLNYGRSVLIAPAGSPKDDLLFRRSEANGITLKNLFGLLLKEVVILEDTSPSASRRWAAASLRRVSRLQLSSLTSFLRFFSGRPRLAPGSSSDPSSVWSCALLQLSNAY